MIQPTQITNFHRFYRELIGFFTFCICVQGKNSDIVAAKINTLIKEPDFFRCMEDYPLEENGLWELIMHDLLRKHKVRNYRRIMHVLKQVVTVDLQTCTLEDLLNIKGVGPKSACFFFLHSRPNQDVVVIDTHLLKFYNEKHKLNESRPTKWEDYLKLGKSIAATIKATFPNLSLAEADLHIWKQQSGRL